MKSFVIGDIHGRVNALEQVLERSGFDMEKDLLISLGDVCDRGKFVKESFDLLLKIKNLKYILGNHDKWFLEWAVTGEPEKIWEFQGGRESIESYNGENVPDNHIQLLKNAPLYFLMDNRLFVHAGINVNKPLHEQTEFDFMWSRSLVKMVMESGLKPKTPFDEIFIGHTPTTVYDNKKPVLINGVVMMDTGAGKGGKLSIMNIETKEFWQSDKTGEK